MVMLLCICVCVRVCVQPVNIQAHVTYNAHTYIPRIEIEHNTTHTNTNWVRKDTVHKAT